MASSHRQKKLRLSSREALRGVNKMSTVKSTKCVRKLERPRPLRLNSDSDGASTASTIGPANGVLTDSPEPLAFPEEKVVRELERLHTSVNNGNFDATLSAQIGSLCRHARGERGLHGQLQPRCACFSLGPYYVEALVSSQLQGVGRGRQ
ncbi:hypothetical protein HPB48_026988 [Haemaphysalis longicornis]|uniref:Uncharacterized protein n=1 Tax=Haemaphysalis longicornis TaxID=44386 RepID=A0A9J6HD94_HAELO|nr:hypothetical protein HPB48_026988 [Haemaphysalis longicornis]